MASEASIEHGAGGRGMNWSEQHPATVPLIRISSHGKKNDVKVSTPTARQESLRGSSPGAARRDMRVDTPFAADHGKDDINWITRVQNRTDELRKLFSLPVTEVLHSSSVSWAALVHGGNVLTRWWFGMLMVAERS